MSPSAGIAGGLLIAFVIGWTFITGSTAGSRPLPVAALLAGAAAALATGVLLGRMLPVIAPAAIALGIGLRLLLTPAARSGVALAEPLGYGNANAALCVVGVTAAAVAGARATRWRARVAVLLLGVLLALSAFATRSSAGSALSVIVLALGGLAPWIRARRSVVTAAGVAFLALVGITVLVGGRLAPEGLANLTEQVFTVRRVALWHDALQLARAHPILGVGPGRFVVESPTAQSDPDASWAHSFVLQQTAEQGIPGGLLTLGLVAWALVALLLASRTSVAAMVGAVGLAAVASHAAIDYVFHFPAVPLSLAIVVGAAFGAPAPPPKRPDEVGG